MPQDSTERTLFYAWQSDLPEKVNRYFIRDAANTALERIKNEMKVEAAPRLDHDTLDVSGTPDIARTIFDKIDACSVFLADVSFIAASAPGTDLKTRKVPNPNVAIELGYALKSVGDSNVICVMNTAFGTTDDLPFDLRNRRFPIRYCLPTSEAPNFKEVFKKLVDDLRNAIHSIVESMNNRAMGNLAERQTALEDRIADDRGNLSKLALRGQFHGFAPMRGVLTLTVLPETPFSPRINLTEPKIQQLLLKCIHGSPRAALPHGRMLVSVESHARSENPYSAVELCDDGAVHAADAYILQGDNVPKQTQENFKRTIPGLIPPESFERDIAETVRFYVDLLRQLSVSASFYATFSLYRVQHFMMGVNTFAMASGHDMRDFDKPEIAPDPIYFPTGCDISSAATVAVRLRPAFDFVWREFGFSASSNFDAAGNWKISISS